MSNENKKYLSQHSYSSIPFSYELYRNNMTNKRIHLTLNRQGFWGNIGQRKGLNPIGSSPHIQRGKDSHLFYKRRDFILNLQIL